MTRTIAALAVCLALGCEAPTVTTSRAQPLQPEVPEGAVVFAIDGDGKALVGVKHEDRRIAHLPSTYAVHRNSAPLDLPLVTALAHDRVHDRLAWVTASGDLQVADEGHVRTLAHDVQPGIAFSPAGDSIVFAAGVAPELDVMTVEVHGEEDPSKVRAEPGPQYLPTFGSTENDVIHASGGAVRPTLEIYDRRRGAAGVLHRDAAGEPIAAPDGIVAPVFVAARLAYFDGAGVRVVDITHRTQKYFPEAHGVVADDAGRLVLVRPSGMLTPIEEP